MPFENEAATKFVKPGEVTGIFWESRDKYEEEVEKVKKLIQALDEIRARTINVETAQTAETMDWLSTLDWIHAKIDQLIAPLPDTSKDDPLLIVRLSLDRFNKLRKEAEPFFLKPAEVVSRRGRAEVVSNWSSLEGLEVEGTGVQGEFDLSTLPDLPELRALELTNCGLTSLSDFPTAQLPKITHLAIRYNPGLDLDTFPTLPNIYHLVLERCGITTVASLTAVRLPALGQLNIASNPGLDLDIFPTLPNIHHLVLEGCGITTVASLTTARLPALGWLNISSNPGLALSTLPDSPTLRRLDIGFCNVKTLEHLTATRFPKLMLVSARDNKGLTRDTLPAGHTNRVNLEL